MKRACQHRLRARTLRPHQCRLDWRRFRDGESLVVSDENLAGASVAVVTSLQHPDETTLTLYFAAATAREFGAHKVELIVPCLPGTPASTAGSRRRTRSEYRFDHAPIQCDLDRRTTGADQRQSAGRRVHAGKRIDTRHSFH